MAQRKAHCATARIAFLTSSDRRCQFVTSSDSTSSVQTERRQGGGQLTQVVCEGKTCGIRPSDAIPAAPLVSSKLKAQPEELKKSAVCVTVVADRGQRRVSSFPRVKKPGQAINVNKQCTVTSFLTI